MPSETTPQQIAAYFRAFCGNMGHRQIEKHLTSLPNWWSLRDNRGQTPLMRVMEARGFSPEMFNGLMSKAAVRKSLLALDHRGRGFWYHAIIHQAWRPKSAPWVDAIAPLVPLGASPKTARGLCTDMMLRNTDRQWAYFFPEGEFARKLYTLPGSTPATWLGANDTQAQQAAEWLIGVSNPRCALLAARALSMMAGKTLAQRRDLAMPMRGAVMFMEYLHMAPAVGHVDELADGVFLDLSRKTRVRLEKRIQMLSPARQTRFFDMLRINDERVLVDREREYATQNPQQTNIRRAPVRL